MKTIANIIHSKNTTIAILDDEGNDIYVEIELGYWRKALYDDKGTRIYYENSMGCIRDSRL